MATDFKLPDLGEGVEEAEVIGVLVSVGDHVEAEQGVIEVETEKASLEVPAPHAGTIAAIHVKVGDVLQVGQPLVAIEAQAGDPPADTTAEVGGESAAPEERAEPAPEAEPSPQREPIPESAPAATSVAEEAKPDSQAAPATNGDGAHELVPAAPSVRAFAREIGVPIEEVVGTGRGGRITTEDVKAHARHSRSAAAGALPSAAQAANGAAPAPAELPDLAQFGPIERERMSPTRRTTARTLHQSWTQSPHITLFQKADITDLDAWRRAHRDRVREAGGNLTLLPILMKIVAAALHEFPRLNASIDARSEEIVYRRYVHIGIATDTERGLVVPVVRDADQKSITELAIEIGELTEKARDRKLGIEEMRGGTFTISNLGGLGVGFFNAILNPPEVGILSVGRAEMEPVWTEGDFVPRLRMPMGINFDHRLIDGADGARALSWIIAALEDPLTLLL